MSTSKAITQLLPCSDSQPGRDKILLHDIQGIAYFSIETQSMTRRNALYFEPLQSNDRSNVLNVILKYNRHMCMLIFELQKVPDPCL